MTDERDRSPPTDPRRSRSDWIPKADAHDLPTRENRLAALGRFAFPPATAAGR